VQTTRSLTHPFTRLAAEVGNRPMPGFVKKSQQGEIYASQLQRRNICSMDGVVSSGFGSMADFVRHGESGVLVAGIWNPSGTLFRSPLTTTYRDKRRGFMQNYVSSHEQSSAKKDRQLTQFVNRACPPSSRHTERWNYKPARDAAQLNFNYRVSYIESKSGKSADEKKAIVHLNVQVRPLPVSFSIA
jgi:hypothetical protein